MSFCTVIRKYQHWQHQTFCGKEIICKCMRNNRKSANDRIHSIKQSSAPYIHSKNLVPTDFTNPASCKCIVISCSTIYPLLSLLYGWYWVLTSSEISQQAQGRNLLCPAPTYSPSLPAMPWACWEGPAGTCHSAAWNNLEPLLCQ